jgi:abortive infection bacteriophage resistance protein
MTNKPAFTIEEQIQLLKSRGMFFRDEPKAAILLKNISYYRFKGYWWDMQTDKVLHIFSPGSYFEDVVDRYNFDRELRLILFDAIELIEIALRTKIIYHLSISYGSLWYTNPRLFDDIANHSQHMLDLQSEFDRSHEIFIRDHKKRYPNDPADAWKVMEVASFGTLSKIYKNLHHQLPEKSIIAKEMGLNLHSELSSWLESITYIRNIIAHHSRLWSRNMVKTPVSHLKNPSGQWFSINPTAVQLKKPYLIISIMVYLCNAIEPNHKIKLKILQLFKTNPNIQIYKMGFLNSWNYQPIWEI